MAVDREPWIKLKIGFRRSGKVADLPSDTARLGWLYALLEAKVQRRMGMFDSRQHFVQVLGRFGRHFDSFVSVGLLHEAPIRCAECKPRHPEARPGELVVHDFRKEQRDATNADRQATYRERHKAEPEPDDEPESNAHRNGSGDATVTPEVTDPVTATVTPDSRARRTTATATTTTRESLSGENPDARAGGRADVQALRDRGWPKVTRAQRKVLDEVLARHDVTGPEFAAAAIRATPVDRDPLEAVMTADRMWQESQRRQAAADEERAKAERAEEVVPWLR